MTDHGERGDQGQRGVAGERGPKGDHGQHGETGRTGARGKTNRLALVGYVLLALGIVAALFFSHRHTAKLCESAKDNRAILRLLISGGDPEKLKPGQPGYDYYSTRPAERKAAHDRTVRVLRETVPPIVCD